MSRLLPLLFLLACDPIAGGENIERIENNFPHEDTTYSKIGNNHPHVSYMGYDHDIKRHVYSVCDVPTVDPSAASKTATSNPPRFLWWKSNSIKWWTSSPRGEYVGGWFRQPVSPPPNDCYHVKFDAYRTTTQVLPIRIYFRSGGYRTRSIQQPKSTY